MDPLWTDRHTPGTVDTSSSAVTQGQSLIVSTPVPELNELV